MPVIVTGWPISVRRGSRPGTLLAAAALAAMDCDIITGGGAEMQAANEGAAAWDSAINRHPRGFTVRTCDAL